MPSVYFNADQSEGIDRTVSQPVDLVTLERQMQKQQLEQGTSKVHYPGFLAPKAMKQEGIEKST